MKKFCFFLLFACLGTFAYAQNSYDAIYLMRDVVYLKNGSIIKGIIVEQIPNQSLKIETLDGSVFVYQMDEVEKIAKERNSGRFSGKERAGAFKGSKGYRGFMEMGGAFPVSRHADGIFSIKTSHGYQFNPHLYVGGGVALNYHFDYGDMFVPLFADATVYFIKNPTSPYFDLKVGYSVGKEKGFYMYPNIGVRFATGRSIAFTFGLGYDMQQYREHSYVYEDYIDVYEAAILSAININLGVAF